MTDTAQSIADTLESLRRVAEQAEAIGPEECARVADWFRRCAASPAICTPGDSIVAAELEKLAVTCLCAKRLSVLFMEP